eukprot:TRINITY_DN4386_c0_g1_i1.p1 TRINITY_DN4386_c0_g1~~TRINITY_DN4386_c0_g1_i1.p1  ORF type:complete len:278 (-),score=52.32 TRINITY_DN4386_c0_g1_i1:72-905(-)
MSSCSQCEDSKAIGLQDLLKIPSPVWKFMVSPFTEQRERRNNWEGLLSVCWKLRQHLLPLFEVEDPKVKYLPLLEGYYISCNPTHPHDIFIKVEGDYVEVLVKSTREDNEMSGRWEMRKVSMDKTFKIEMEVQGDVDMEGLPGLPVLVFQRAPRIPYPVKVLRQGNLRKVEKSEYETMVVKEKKYKMVRCMVRVGSMFPKDVLMNSEIALEVFQQVPKDFTLRTQLMFAMPEILETTSHQWIQIFHRDRPVQKQREEIIAAMIRRFPSLSTIFQQNK